MNWIRNNPAVAIIGGLVGLGILAFLAFGVFGIQTANVSEGHTTDGPDGQGSPVASGVFFPNCRSSESVR